MTGNNPGTASGIMKPLKQSDEGRDYRPPNAPWQELKASDPPAGHLSFYYSDGLSKFAVRDVTRRNDNKSDPNVETGTYGLFSTCERIMRARAVRLGHPFIFFVTNYRGERCLTGFYRAGWFAEGRPVLAYKGMRDFALAASEVRFIHPPLPLATVAKHLKRPNLTGWFRTFKSVDAGDTRRLLDLLRKEPDRTPTYVEEVRRLEMVNKRFHGVRYVNWGQSAAFDWSLAPDFLTPETKALPDDFDMTTVSLKKAKGGFWHCRLCDLTLQSVSPLKRCPGCGSVGWLVPGKGKP